jgi:hypothetical protein
MVVNLESPESMVLGTMDRDRVAKFDKPAVKIMFQVAQIVSFLLRRLERGLRFRNLGFCGHHFKLI